ncbi:3'-5' exonuclease [Thermovibrio ammonificans]
MEELNRLISIISPADRERIKNEGDENKLAELVAFERLERHLREVPSILYFNPMLFMPDGREVKPDILWLYPRRGILLIEVKAWNKEFIETLKYDGSCFILPDGSSRRNPLRQAESDKNKLLSLIKRHVLRNREFKNTGKSGLPCVVEYVVYFPNLTRKEFEAVTVKTDAGEEPLRDLLSPARLIFEGDRHIKERLVNIFNLYDFRVEPQQVMLLRKLLFPWLTVTKVDSRIYPSEVAIMDVSQERLLNSHKEGYRILRGTAGSGKTVVLVGKAVKEKLLNPEKKVLILSFTNSLVSEIKREIERLIEVTGITDISVSDFDIFTVDEFIHSLSKEFNLEVKGDFREVRKKLAEKLEDENLDDSLKYNVVLCDESQDFTKEVFPIIKQILKDDYLLVFGVDETQRIYENTDWRWKDVGFDATGKVLILRKSYRNPTKIFSLAKRFLQMDKRLMDELKELDAIVATEAVESVRKDPGVVEFISTSNEFLEVVERVKKLLDEGVEPGEIFVLVPFKAFVEKFRSVFSEDHLLKDKVHFLSSDSEKSEKYVPPDRLVVMPYHSSKGLERRIVFVVGSHNLPYESSEKVSEKRRDRRLLYVALTRAQERLFVTIYKQEKFLRELIEVYESLEKDERTS